jgi:hypothetical protein
MDYLPHEKMYRRAAGEGFEVFLKDDQIEIRQDSQSEVHAIFLILDEAEDLVEALNSLIADAKKEE